MQVASLENCKKLYELSGWQEVRQYWESYPISGSRKLRTASTPFPQDKMLPELIVPSYDAGYLLRKLTHEIVEKPNQTTYEHYALRLGAETSAEWYANYWMFDCPRISLDDMEPSDTPEDALCLLAIELFKQGILTKEATKQ